MVSLIVDLFKFSPNGVYLACVLHTEKQILIRNCTDHIDIGLSRLENKFNITHKFNLTSTKTNQIFPVDSFEWSSDSSFLAVGCKRNGVISVFSLTTSKNNNWKCTINFGEKLGLESFRWGSDARHLVCMANNFEFLSIWPLTADKQVHYIKDIAQISTCRGIDFSGDGSRLAVIKALPSKDKLENETVHYYITTYTKSSDSKLVWREAFEFNVISKDPAGISWNPTESEFVCIWDSHLYSNLYIYNSLTGELIRHYSPYGISSAGFYKVQWSATGNLLVATVRNKNEIHVLNGLTFGVLIHDVLEPKCMGFIDEFVEGQCADIFFEPEGHQNLGMKKYHRLTKWPGQLKMDPTLAIFPKESKSMANTQAKVSHDGTLLACSSPNVYPRIVWIYDLVSAVCPIAVLIHQNPVLDSNWNPNSNKLCIVCGDGFQLFNGNENSSNNYTNGLLYFWEKTNSTTISSKAWIHNTTSAKLSFRGVQWNSIGNLLLAEDASQKIHLFPNL